MDSKLELSVNTIRTPEHPYYIVRIVHLINQISSICPYLFLHDISEQKVTRYITSRNRSTKVRWSKEKTSHEQNTLLNIFILPSAG